MSEKIGWAGKVPGLLLDIRQEIEMGLDRYLQTKGTERGALTIRLLRLKWAAEELEKGNGTG